MSIPKVGLNRLEKLVDLLKMPRDEKIAITSLETTADLKYTLLVFFDNKSVKRIIDLMTTQFQPTKVEVMQLSPLFLSLIKEVGSILLLKYVEALNDFLNAKSFPAPPTLRIGTVDSILENEIADVKIHASKALYIECDVFTSEKSIVVDMVIVPHEDTAERFMNSLFSEDE